MQGKHIHDLDVLATDATGCTSKISTANSMSGGADQVIVPFRPKSRGCLESGECESKTLCGPGPLCLANVSCKDSPSFYAIVANAPTSSSIPRECSEPPSSAPLRGRNNRQRLVGQILGCSSSPHFMHPDLDNVHVFFLLCYEHVQNAQPQQVVPLHALHHQPRLSPIAALSASHGAQIHCLTRCSRLRYAGEGLVGAGRNVQPAKVSSGAEVV